MLRRPLSPWFLFAFILVFAVTGVQSQIALEPWVAVGEQPPPGGYRGTYSSAYWQVGACLAYEWTWVRPYAEFGVSPLPTVFAWGVEGLLAVGFGHDIGWFKPMLTLSTGLQSVKREKYLPYDLPDGLKYIDSPPPYVMHRQTHRVLRLGFRGELFRLIWVDWEGDIGDQSPAIPMWRMRLGYRHSFALPLGHH